MVAAETLFLTAELLLLPRVCEEKKVHCILGVEKIFNVQVLNFTV